MKQVSGSAPVGDTPSVAAWATGVSRFPNPRPAPPIRNPYALNALTSQIGAEVTHETFFENSFGDRYLYRINREAFNKPGARAIFDAYFGGKSFAENTLHVIVGTDSGLLLRRLASRDLPSGIRYSFIELPDILA